MTFKPTKEQLENLAKAAKVEIMNIDGILYLVSNSLLEEDWAIWQPHKDMNQIAMVIKGLSGHNKDIYMDNIYNYWYKNIRRDDTWNHHTYWVAYEAHPSISCEKLLEVI